MTITTKAGDRGSTTIKDVRLPKSDPIIEALGNLDETSSLIIYMQAHLKLETAPWEQIVSELYQISSYIARYIDSIELGDAITRMEAFIKQKQFITTKFIFPLNNEKVALIHYVRTVVRRAERSLVAMNQTVEINPQVLVYMNRLSDYMFANEL